MSTQDAYDENADGHLTEEEMQILEDEKAEQAEASAAEEEDQTEEVQAEADDEPEEQEAAAEEEPEEDQQAAAEEEPEEEGETVEEQPEQKADDNYDPDLPPPPMDALDKLKAEREDLDRKLDEYEITSAEHRKLVAEIDEKIVEHRVESKVSQLWEKMEWRRVQKDFFRENPQYAEPNSLAFNTLNSTIQWLTQKPENANRSNEWFLQEAKRQVESMFPGAQAAEEPAPKKEAAPAKPKPAKAGKKPDLPQTLADVPAAGSEDTGDRYSALDAKSGLDLEAAYAAMADRDQDAFLSH